MMQYLKDILITKDNTEITITFYAHASLGIAWNGIHIYVDPVGDKYGVDYSLEPKADLILITHHHKDHFDADTIELLSKEDTIVYVSKKCSQVITTASLAPYDFITFHGISIQTVPAYNITEDYIQYHPKHDGGLGYILSIGGSNFYIAGDTEDTEDVLSLKDIDVAFLPVNQPYTMTIEQVINVVKTIHPSVIYPYHTSSQMGCTDVEPLVEHLHGFCEVRIRNMR